jgi:citronellol/citronellal dehydrogenase
VNEAVEKTVATFGGIDIVVNNASAIDLSPASQQAMKRYDLMQNINCRGTFLLSKASLPHLEKSANGHILTLSPPIDMDPKWFGAHLAYTIAKYGMSMCTIGLAEETKGKIAANSLWPRTIIATAAVQNLLGGDDAMAASRSPEIMADAAHAILTRDAADEANTGNFYIDDEVLATEGVTDLSKYGYGDGTAELALDLFLSE